MKYLILFIPFFASAALGLNVWKQADNFEGIARYDPYHKDSGGASSITQRSDLVVDVIIRHSSPYKTTKTIDDVDYSTPGLLHFAHVERIHKGDPGGFIYIIQNWDQNWGGDKSLNGAPMLIHGHRYRLHLYLTDDNQNYAIVSGKHGALMLWRTTDGS